MGYPATAEQTDGSIDSAANTQNAKSENGSHLHEREVFCVVPNRKTHPTPRQASILDFIVAFRKRKGYPPTLREIGSAFAIRSTNGVNDHLNALERKGYIVRTGAASRGIRVVDPLTGESLDPPTPSPPPDAVAFLKAENEALRSLLRRIQGAAHRLPELTAEMVIVLGDVRDVLVARGGA